MFFDAAGLDRESNYRLLNGTVVPRPIAWVSSGAPPKPLNLAPFSAFAWVSHQPPMIGFTVNRRGGERKDTVRNILEDREYVVHVAGEQLIDQLHASSEWVDPEVSEAERLELAVAPSRLIGVPRLTDAPIAMECRLERVLEFGDQADEFVIGRIVGWHVSDDVLDGQRIDTERLRPIARIAGPKYARLGEVLERSAYPG